MFNCVHSIFASHLTWINLKQPLKLHLLTFYIQELKKKKQNKNNKKTCSFIQSTLVISNSKVLSEILRDIRTSTYQICRIEEKIIRTIAFNKFIYNWTLEFRDISKILWKRGEIAPSGAISPLFHNIFTCCKIFMFSQGQDFHFEISGYSRSEEITRVNCICLRWCQSWPNV